MIVALLAVAGAMGGLLVAHDVLRYLDFGGSLEFIGALVCTAKENVPGCDPADPDFLKCALAAGSGLAAGGPAAPPYDERPDGPDRTPRDYAPEPPPGHQPPPPRSPQDALNDPDFRKAKEDWARDNADRFPTVPEQTEGGSAFDVLVESIRSEGSRR